MGFGSRGFWVAAMFTAVVCVACGGGGDDDGDDTGFRAVALGSGPFVAVGTEGLLSTSPDGRGFEGGDSHVDPTLNGITFALHCLAALRRHAIDGALDLGHRTDLGRFGGGRAQENAQSR